MGHLLDAIGALVIGGMFFITMFNSMFDVRSAGHDLIVQLALNKVSEDVVNGLDSLYLAKVGAGIPTDSIAIFESGSKRFEFRGRMSVFSSIDTIEVVQEDSTDLGYPFKVYRNGILELGPFWLSDSLKFTYYDIDENETSIPDSVHSMKVEMEFTYDMYSSGTGKRKIRKRLTFWKYFRNLYL